jgi:hypothetical protein
VKLLADFLRAHQMSVFAFVDEGNRPDGLDTFTFGPESWDGPKPLTETQWTDFMRSAKTQRAFKADMAGLMWADTVIVFLPCGRSAHLEAGYAKGSGKELYFYGELPLGQYEAMYGMADGLFLSDELPQLLKILTTPRFESKSTGVSGLGSIEEVREAQKQMDNAWGDKQIDGQRY